MNAKKQPVRAEKNKHNANERKKNVAGVLVGVPKIPVMSMALRTQLGADPTMLEGMAEYLRKDETEVLIPEANIATELTADSKVNVRRSYYLSWLVPDPENNRGAILSVDRFHVEIHNDGIYDINIVAQQPHGHEDCPSSVAAWVLLFNTTLKAGAARTVSIKPVDNNFVVPLRSDANGADSITYLAFSAARQSMSSGGSTVDKAEVGLRLVTTVHYKASGNALEGGSFFSLRTYSNDHAMFVVDPKPPVPIAIQDIVAGGATMGWAKNEAGFLTPTLAKKDGTIVVDGWTGLSTGHTYRLPIGIPGLTSDKLAVGCYLRNFATATTPTKKMWYVTSAPASATTLAPGDGVKAPTPDKLPVLSSDSLLYPLTKNNYFRIPLRKRGSLGAQLLCRPVGAQQFLATTWKEDFLAALSFVVGVIKVAAAVAGAVGVLNVSGSTSGPEEEDRMSAYEVVE